MKTIPIKQGGFALVDDCDFDSLSKFTWLMHNAGYAIRREEINGVQKNIRMHRQIMGFPDGKDIDHINRNKLDNRKDNLRVCTRLQNSKNQKLKPCNTSGFKGVSKLKTKWQANIRNGKTFSYLGCFNAPKEAAQAYDRAALRLHGEFACTNKMLGLL